MRKKVISVLLGVALLTGCATMSDEARTKGEGTAVGAGVGAALGAGLGALLGGRQGALLGAGLGAAEGAGGGYLYGSHVANRKKDYARQEDYLNALVVSAQQVNDRTDALRQEIAQLETETAQRIEQYNQRTVQKSAAEEARTHPGNQDRGGTKAASDFTNGNRRPTASAGARTTNAE